MGAAAALAKVCVKPVVQIMSGSEGEGGAMQMCHTMVFSGVNEPVRTVLMRKKKTNPTLFIWKLHSGSL